MTEAETYESVLKSTEFSEAVPTSLIKDDAIQTVLLRIRLRAARRISWLRKIWTERNSQHENSETQSLYPEVESYLSDDDAPAEENFWYVHDPVNEQINQRIAETESILERDHESRLSRLCSIFNLDRTEKDFLQACIAISLDPNLAVVYAYLQDHKSRGYTTGYLVARLFGLGRFSLLSPASNLKTWNLIEETPSEGSAPARYNCDPFILGWVLGEQCKDAQLTGKTLYQRPLKPLNDFPLNTALEILNKQTEGSASRLIIYGPEGSGRKTFAAYLSMEMDKEILFVLVDQVDPSDWPRVFIHTHRYALLNGMNLGWQGSSLHERPWPELPAAETCIEFIIAERDQKIKQAAGYLDYPLYIPDIPAEERQKLWMDYVPMSREWDRKETLEMIRSHRSTIGQIVIIGKINPDSIAKARELLNISNGLRLGELARRLSCTFVWDDLIIPQPIKGDLEDFCFEARDRIIFWESPEARRLFPLGRGLIALFNGGPGTGKTMAAQVIAASLQLDLYRIDLSTMVSKYIGETAKNIERILSRAQEMDIILFFDEADALFSKRTEVKDANDRFANTDTNFLLQAIEHYPGIAILATNKKGNIDPGFTRRLRYVVDFPKPDASSRLIIWRRVLGELLGKPAVKRHTKNLEHIATIADMTGAQIKQSILSGIFMARKGKTRLSVSHLLRGIERELQKEGRGLGRSADGLI